MTFPAIHNYADFVKALRLAGFSMGGENGEGIFTLCDCFAPNIQWHTGDAETDPWTYRMRVLSEKERIGYGKIFLQKGGYLTREWAPYFIVLRRSGAALQDMYQEGRVTHLEKQIYGLVEEKGEAALHEIKAVVSDKGLETALARLQTSMYLTISGQTMKLSKDNLPYGWPVTTFCTTETFWGPDITKAAAALSKDEAREAITRQIKVLNPEAQEKAIRRFLG